MALSNLIPVINKLQDVLTKVGSDVITLPQIVVVGSQSSGKSSVLEGIVGKDFLPRGSGIVTRRPLILQLIHLERAPPADQPQEWGEFIHAEGQKFTDFAAIRQEITDETSRIVGDNKGVSDRPINLRIYSPKVLNLTLVDLPGLTKVPVGDQPPDIEVQIRRMIMSFISREETLILAVTPANTDLANSDALQLARAVDPNGYRTLGVITKLDLMDRGTNALDVLNGEVINLKLGFIGVVNRSQQDILNNTAIHDAVAAEATFLKEHHAYRAIAHQMGTPFLARTLNHLLIEHIKAHLPGLKSRIQSQVTRVGQELAALGNPVADSGQMGAIVLEIITKFSTDFKSAIEGSQTHINPQQLYGGARISCIFHENYFNAIEAMDACDGLHTDEIRTVIRNATGIKGSLFIPEASFELLVRQAIGRLSEPSLKCCDLVYDELLNLLNMYRSKDLERFPLLRDELHRCVAETLQRVLKPTRSMVANLINIELAYINTRHPDFMRALPSGEEALSRPDTTSSTYELVPSGERKKEKAAAGGGGASSAAAPAAAAPSSSSAQKAPPANSGGGGFFSIFGPKRSTVLPNKSSELVAPPAVLRATAPPDFREQQEVDLVRNLLNAYFSIVKKNVQDNVPKAIMFFLVNQATSKIQSELVKEMYREEKFAILMNEPEELVQRRVTAKETMEILRQAEAILNEIRDYRPTSSNTVIEY